MRLRVVIAEDDLINRLMLERALTAAGFDVAVAADGPAALALIERGDVDLVLLDVMMPGQSGLEVLKVARARGFAMPIIMVTALDSPEDVATALECGADDYVTKPFSPQVLLARIKLRLRPARAQAAAPPLPLDADDVLEISPSGVIDAEEPPPPPPEDAVKPGLLRSFLSKLKRAADHSQSASPLAPLTPGTVLAGRYRIAQVLGRGAFGVVHQARQVELEMDVAVKVLCGDTKLVHDGISAYERFRREAMRACRVRDEHAVRVIDFGVTPDDRPYLVMELLVGPTLEERLRQGPLTPRDAALTVGGVLSALAAAHREGVVHQDVKASNVVLAERHGAHAHPTLIDFGAAAELRDKPSYVVLGTASHMAPERFATGSCDAKGDVYAAGVLLYHAVTGQLPFANADVDELARLHATASPVPPSQLKPTLSPAWDAVLARLLAKLPTARPTAAEAATLVRALD
ncbi:MAG: response regulator [Archangium sp.]|nr:response regulator [Archangium sp.]